MKRVDQGVGIALALLALLVVESARHFPNVPGQKLGAGFLPMLVGTVLLACAAALFVRGWRSKAPRGAPRAAEQVTPALVVIGSVALYVLAADTLGFLLVAPLVLLAALKIFGVRWRPALWWAIGGTLVVHLAFYKLLRVPLPWGVIRPFY